MGHLVGYGSAKPRGNNIPKTTEFSVYKIDLEIYFKKPISYVYNNHQNKI
jgi:hypothetical protein